MSATELSKRSKAHVPSMNSQSNEGETQSVTIYDNIEKPDIVTGVKKPERDAKPDHLCEYALRAANKGPPSGVGAGTLAVVDPFERVFLLNNIDNAILMSFRTPRKQNNILSNTLKVVHNKFTPKELSRHVKSTFKKATQALYSVSEVESSC